MHQRHSLTTFCIHNYIHIHNHTLVVVDPLLYLVTWRVAFSALTLLVGQQEGHPAHKKYGEWWRWALVSPDGVAPSRMVSVSASVDLPLHYKVQKFSSGTDSPGWSQIKGRKTVVCVLCCVPLKSWSRDHEFTSGETAFHWPRELVITSGELELGLCTSSSRWAWHDVMQFKVDWI